MRINYKDLLRKHVREDWNTNIATLNNIAILNVKVGKEATSLVSLFELDVSTMMLPSGQGLSGLPHSEEYISFLNHDGKSSIHSDARNQAIIDSVNVKEYYYPDVEDALNELKLNYPSQFYTNGLTASTDEDIHEMYDLFGMEIRDD